MINCEEYYPFGETSYGSYGKKRYRFCGKEKDEESGLYYYGMRYYSPWTCRFMSVDPLAPKYMKLTPYQYASNDPINSIDIDGLEGSKGTGNTEGVTNSNPMFVQNPSNGSNNTTEGTNTNNSANRSNYYQQEAHRLINEFKVNPNNNIDASKIPVSNNTVAPISTAVGNLKLPPQINTTPTVEQNTSTLSISEPDFIDRWKTTNESGELNVVTNFVSNVIYSTFDSAYRWKEVLTLNGGANLTHMNGDPILGSERQQLIGGDMLTLTPFLFKGLSSGFSNASNVAKNGEFGIHIGTSNGGRFGHNIVGLETPGSGGSIMWFELRITSRAGKTINNTPILGQASEFQYMEKVNFSKFDITRLPLSGEQANNALKTINTLTGQGSKSYNILTNSCTSNAVKVLNSTGAYSAPTFTFTPSSLRNYVKSLH